MSVKIRLRRDGAKKRPFYHVVAADSRRARNGRFIEQLGYYNPMVAANVEPILVLKEERIRYWLGVGAQPSDTAAALLRKKGILEAVAAHPGAGATKSDNNAAAPAAAAAAAAVATPEASPVSEETPAPEEAASEEAASEETSPAETA